MNDYRNYDLGYLCKLRDWISMERLDWTILSSNPNACRLLEQNPDKIGWYFLSHNTNAIHLLKENPDEINWTHLSCRPSIFEYDYEAMRLRMKIIAEDLMADRFHPRNFDKWIGWGFDEFQECEF